MRDPRDLDVTGADGSMIAYIRRNFADILGPHVKLLDQPGGLDALAELVRSGKIGTRSRRAA